MKIDPRFFPTVMIIFDIAAAAVYLSGGLENWRKFIYWFAAGILTFCVTY